MEKAASGNWIADLKTMKCFNMINKIVIGFRKQGREITGKITYVPLALLKEWGATPYGSKLMQNAVIEAECIFLRAYLKNKMKPDRALDKKTPQTHIRH